MTHIAVDLALSRTGVAWGAGPTEHDTIICPAGIVAGGRLQWWSTHLGLYALAPDIDTLVVEAPIIYPGHMHGQISTLKLHGVVELFAYRHDLHYRPVAPAVIKKYATGTGNASKDDMLAAAHTAGFDGKSYDACDAWHLWRYWNDKPE